MANTFKNLAARSNTNGRKMIVLDEKINDNNAKDLILKSVAYHKINKERMEYLISYYLGNQDILKRPSPYASNVNNKVVVNYASSTTRSLVGYFLGIPIKLSQNKDKAQEDIQKLNEIFDYENTKTVDIEAGLYASITGLGYFCTLPSGNIGKKNIEEDDYDETPEYPVNLFALDPRYAYVVHTNEIGNPVNFSVLYYEGDKYTKYTAYTKKKIYTYRTDTEELQIENNTMKINPITEINNNLFNVGDFEPGVPILNAINKVSSDSINDIENTIQSLLVIINSELDDKEKLRQIKENRVMTLLGKNGSTLSPDAKFINQQLDKAGLDAIKSYLELAYNVVVGIPDRQSMGNGGGDTGKAVELRNGFEDIEIIARIKEMYFYKAKKHQIACVLSILKTAGLISKDVKVSDVNPVFSRTRGDNILSKAQAIQTLRSSNIFSDIDILNIVGVGTNPLEMVENGKKQRIENAELQVEINEIMKASENNPEENNSGNNGEQLEQVKDMNDMNKKENDTSSTNK